jgi:hypothetical protein
MDVPPLIDGDLRFSQGGNSYTDPIALAPESFVFGLNALARGGVFQARPGFDCEAKLPDGKLQGLTTFYPQSGLPQTVAAVDGQIYVSDYPYKEYVAVPGVKMSANAEQVFMEQATKTVQRNADSSLSFIDPISLLMLQDGLSPCSYYDGHQVQIVTGPWGTPMGTHMKWAGGRLWVARRNIVFPGDIADPTCFFEMQYNQLGGLTYYIMPEQVTGFALTPGTQIPQLLCFTQQTTSTFRCDIRDRSIWPQMENFQRLIFPGLGCVSERSLTVGAGMLWWYSNYGWTSLDTAAATMVSTKIRYADNEMLRSKSQLGANLSKIASTSFDNLLLVSVPNASTLNRHTWVLDLAAMDLTNSEFPISWAAIWTGVQPVQWTKVVINGKQSLYCASVDQDGHNRVYKAFNPNKRDNGVDFPWRFESRAYSLGNVSLKNFRYLEYALSELAGQADLKFSWAGVSRGPWKPFATVSFKAREGNIDAQTEFTADTYLYGLKKQSRNARTEDLAFAKADSLASAGVEGPIYSIEMNREQIDKAFQICIEGSGPCAIRALRLFADPVQDPSTGQVAKPEDDNHFVRFDGAAADNELALQVAPDGWTSIQTAQATYKNWVGTGTATINSPISQADADKRALQIAQAKAQLMLEDVYNG